MVRQTKNNQWGLVAGKLKGEFFEDALIREMDEEAGINLRDVGRIERWDIPYVPGIEKDKMGVVYKTKARISDEEINSKKPNDPAIAEVRVFSLQEVMDLIYFKQDLIYKKEYNLRNLIRWAVVSLQEDKTQAREVNISSRH